MHVRDSMLGKRRRKGVATEMWITPRAWVPPHVHEPLDAMIGEQANKFFQRTSGMTNRVDGRTDAGAHARSFLSMAAVIDCRVFERSAHGSRLRVSRRRGRFLMLK